MAWTGDIIGDATLAGDWYIKRTAYPVEGQAGPQRMEETWVGDKDTYTDFRDKYTFGVSHGNPDYADLLLHEVIPKMSGKFGQARLVWINAAQAHEEGTPAGSPPPIGSTSRSMVSGELEIALELNKNYSNLWVDDKPGIESFMSPAPTLVYKYVSDEFTFSEADLVSNVFKRSTAGFPPMGLDGNISYDNWLMWSREVSDEGTSREGNTIFVITSTWRWSPDDGWDNQIYDEAG